MLMTTNYINNLKTTINSLLGHVWKGRWQMKVTDRCPGHPKWWGHALQSFGPLCLAPGLGWGRNFLHPEKQKKLNFSINKQIQDEYKVTAQWACSKQRKIHTWTNRGFPKRSALSRFFLKASSRKLVLVILRSLYSFIINSVAWPDGSMISGYLVRVKLKLRTNQKIHTLSYRNTWKTITMPEDRVTDLLNLLSMMAFSVQRSSAGRELACQRSLSSALDRYSVLAISVRNWNGKKNK